MNDQEYAEERQRIEERQLITFSYTDPETLLSCAMTQDYFPYFDAGHYNYAITNKNGHIIIVGCTLVGAPNGKITEDTCKEILTEKLRISRTHWEEEGKL